jgi:hypothetical protein
MKVVDVKVLLEKIRDDLAEQIPSRASDLDDYFNKLLNHSLFRGRRK